jgi:peptidase E
LIKEKCLTLAKQINNNMNLLLISNSTNFGETYLAWPMSQLESFCEKNNLTSDSKIVFVPFAGVFINGNP